MYKDSQFGLNIASLSAAVEMSSSKVFFCDLCVILLFGLSFILADEKSKGPAPDSDGPKGNCSCGGFPTSMPEARTAPLLSQSPGLVVKCDEEGANTCKSLCIALATATKAKGPEILCNRLKDADELKLSAFYKACDKPWTYVNMTTEEPLCCNNSKVKVCASVQNANATLNATDPNVDAKTIM